MFDIITKKSQEYLQKQIDELKQSCDNDPGVAEFVRYILAYSDQMAYCGGDEDAKIGRELIQFIWQITGQDLSSMGNEYHFNPSWAGELNFLISNYYYDDGAFDFEQSSFNGAFKFKAADDTGRWISNPMVLVEAAKANCKYYANVDRDSFSRLRDKVDGSKVLELAGWDSNV